MAVERCAANRIDENISGAVDIDELPEIDRLAERVPGPPRVGRDLAQDFIAAVVTLAEFFRSGS
jgi:hypothetical protein